jgi:hypothetical protein
MRLAITDACILIDLCDLRLTTSFFELDLEIHTTVDVFQELYDSQRIELQAFCDCGRLTLHSIDESARKAMSQRAYPRSLSENDRTVLYIAEMIGAIVLSSDKPVRAYAKRMCIEYHGMLWIFDRLLALGLITPALAAEKLQQLIRCNVIYQNNTELVGEMKKRLAAWQSGK